jgi:hypothetical protein
MASAAGFILSMLGGLLDFASGSLLLINRMGGYLGLSSVGWGLGLFVLGGMVVLTGVESVTMAGMRFKNIISALMIVYGLAMLFVGWAMSSGTSLLMGGASLNGYAMVAVGVLMIANGALMTRSPTMT